MRKRRREFNLSSNWSLSQLLENLHRDIQQQLEIARQSFAHPGVKSDASEEVWLTLLTTYLPARYAAIKAHVVDSKGNFSDQIDIVVRDKQYSPFIFYFKDQAVVPAESVYAVFEAKQTVNAELIDYAETKAESVRKLHRTSLPIPHAGGTYPAKPPSPILAGILSFQSEWNPALGDTLVSHLTTDDPNRQLDLGCIAAHGIFSRQVDGSYQLTPERKPATAFLFELIARLQMQATVPMIDVKAYAEWLSPDHQAAAGPT